MMHHCESCDREWSSRLAAEECAEVDASEDEDRRNGRLYRSVN